MMYRDVEESAPAGATPAGGPRRTRGAIASAATAAIVGACLLMVVLGSAALLGLCRADVVLSGSMRPAFSPGSVVLAIRSSAEAVETGDVIVYLPPVQTGSVPVAHRVISTGTDASTGAKTLLTKGDSNPQPDPWGPVTATEPVWVVKADVPLIGHLAAGIKAHRGALALLTASLALAWIARKVLTS